MKPMTPQERVSDVPMPVPGLGGSRVRPPVPVRVLLVEDDDRLRRLSRRFLELQSWEVLEAADAVGAIELLRDGEEIPDVMITDVTLPDFSGPDLVARVHARYPEVGVLYVSGYSQPEEVVILNGEVYLQKPYRFEALIGEVRELLERRASQSSAAMKPGPSGQ